MLVFGYRMEHFADDLDFLWALRACVSFAFLLLSNARICCRSRKNGSSILVRVLAETSTKGQS